jgi:ferredoxin-fold anticodon binding domain-containing protein
MADEFVRAYVGNRVNFVLVNEAGQWSGVLQEVGDQWVKVLVGKGRTTLIPIVNIRSMSLEGDIQDAAPPTSG